MFLWLFKSLIQMRLSEICLISELFYKLFKKNDTNSDITKKAAGLTYMYRKVITFFRFQQ